MTHRRAKKARLLVVVQLDILPCHLALTDLLKRDNLGATSERLAKVLNKTLDCRNGRFGKRPQFAARVLFGANYRRDVAAVFLFIKCRDTPNLEFQQAFDILVGERPHKTVRKRRHAVVHFLR